MFGYVTKWDRNKNPLSYVGINYANPLAKNLIGHYAPNSVGYTSGSNAVLNHDKLIYPNSGTDAANNPHFGRYAGLEGKSTWSMLWVGTVNTLHTRGGLFSKGPYFCVASGYGDSSGIFVYPTGSSADYYLEGFSGTFVAGERVTIVVTMDNGTLSVYKNGALLGTLTRGAGSTNTATSSTNNVQICSTEQTDGTIYSIDSVLEYFALFDSVLSPISVKKLTNNPWQLFVPDYRQSYLVANTSGGGNVTTTLTGTGIVSAAQSTLVNTVVSLLGVSSTFSNGNISVSTEATAALTGASAATVSETLQPQTLGSVVGNAAAIVSEALQPQTLGTVVGNAVTPLLGNLDYGAFSAVSGESAQILQTSALQPQTTTFFTGSVITTARGSVNYGVFSALLGTPTQVLQTSADSATAAFLLGALSTAQAGSVTASTGAVTQLTGLQITPQQGSVTPASSSVVSITGESVPTISGSLASVRAAILAGTESGTQTGAVSASIAVLPQGIGISLFQGNVSVVSSDVTVALTGASLTGLQAAISAVLAASASGSVSSTFSETLSASLSKVLQGASAQTLSGDLLSAISVVVNGSSVTVFAGSVITESGAESVDWFIVEHKSNTVLVEYSSNTILANGK